MRILQIWINWISTFFEFNLKRDENKKTKLRKTKKNENNFFFIKKNEFFMEVICVYVLEMNKAFSTILYQFLACLSKFTKMEGKMKLTQSTSVD